MTRPDIDAMDALVAKATEGPWTSRNRSVVGPSGPVAGSYKFRASDGYTSIATIDLEVPDAEFIAAAREYIPAINAYVRKLEGSRAAIIREVAEMIYQWPYQEYDPGVRITYDDTLLISAVINGLFSRLAHEADTLETADDEA